MKWIPITYYEFYDCPRLFIAEWNGALFIFDCPFSDSFDEYPEYYSVYRLSLDVYSVSSLSEVLSVIVSEAPCCEVAVCEVVFDESRRRAIGRDVLRRVSIKCSSI
jgi:hypothetical protein